jgi:hypothetical protein
MSNLLEVVFENVSKVNVSQLLLYLVYSAKRIVSADTSEDIELLEDKGKLNKQAVESLISFSGDVTALIKLEEMKVDGIVLPLVLLRLVKYNDLYDIDFNFDRAELKHTDMPKLIKALHMSTSSLAKEYEVKNWFAGMEPASDENTRYFTNNELGSLK